MGANRTPGWRGMLILTFLALALASPAKALEDFEEDLDRDCDACPLLTDTWVDSLDLDRPEFSRVFSLYVNWNYEDPQGSEWDIADLRAFGDAVMPDYEDEGTPWESIAHRTAFYFGNDVAAPYDSIVFPRPWTTPLEYYRHFNITLRFVASEGLNSCAGDSCTACQFDSWDTPVTQIAHDNFAHEFGHLGDFSLRGAGCADYGAAYTEFPAMSSEYYSGYFDCTLEHDGHYQMSLGGSDWEKTYNGLIYDSDRRGPIRAFTLYLQEHFRGEDEHGADDLLYAWIHGEDCSPPTYGPHDWDALAERCNDWYFNSYFASSGADPRLRELFQEYALAMWVNDDGFSGVGDDAVWDTSPAAHKPQELRYFSGEDGGYGCNDEEYEWIWDAARVHPLYNTVDTSKRFKRDQITYHDIYPNATVHDSLLCVLTRPIAFETYGMFVMPFVADDELDEDTEGYNLHIGIVLQDSLYAECGESWDFENPEFDPEPGWDDVDNDLLHFWILGYPADEALKDTLDLAGASAVLLGQRSYPSDSLYVDKEIELVVPGFAREYSSVVVVATLTEEDATEGVLDVNTIPFLYKYWADKDFTVSGLTEFVYADTLRVHGEVTVPDGVALSFDEGTVLAFAEHDLNPETRQKIGFKVSGELTLAGQSGQPVVLVPMDAGEEWSGFTVCSGGELTIDYADITGEYELLCLSGATAVDIQHSSFTLADEAVGFDLSDAASASVLGCVIQEATTVRLAAHSLEDVEIHQASGTTASAVCIEGDATLDSVLIYSASTAIKCESGEPVLTDVSANSASTQSCSSLPTYGLRASSNAEVSATNCTFDGFCKAIRLDDTAKLTLRSSAVIDALDIGVYVDDRYASVDMGYMASPPEAGMEGNNCVATADTTDLRVFNRGAYTVLASANYWDTATPTSGLFGGSVWWSDYLTSCPGGSGGPGLSLLGPALAVAEAFGFAPPVPNPFNPSCELRFTLPATGAASTLTIYDLSGRHLATLFSGRADGREHSLRWDGRDERGHPMSSGVYFAKLSVGSESQSRKLVVLK